MNISNKTILITGGGSGIGYETAKLLSQQGNKIIIVGRNADKIKKAGEELNVIAIAADITIETDVDSLIKRVSNEFPELSILINNAAVAYIYRVAEDPESFEKAQHEMLVNYLSPIRLTERLLPILKNQQEAAIVNVSSNVVYVPLAVLPSYSATKAALHSYTLALRRALAMDTAVKVFELQPSLVNTDAAKGIGGEENGIDPGVVVRSLIAGIQNDVNEIYVGDTAALRDQYFSDPLIALETLNQGL
ncbi:SDR family oxidoreductase [Pedobacter antarcticus]|uniref:SDR family oxidoreductase n=1 Tax=Pedobacter antarcticus TaxID=34086 RepID=UPI001C5854B5|nr:SDR family NAD(P)-dependent oxidoreductase [Pedobacter antarcticus]